jgi:cytochrome c556
MYRLFALAGALAAAVAFTCAAQEKKDDKKTPTIEEIMEDAHGKDGLRAKVAAAAKGKKWDDAKKPVEQWVKLAGSLGKNDPPKGEKDSWKKLTGNYEKTVKELAAAVKGEKEDGVKSALASITKSCGACHKAHKP